MIMAPSSPFFRRRLGARSLAALLLVLSPTVQAQEQATGASVQHQYRRAIQAFEQKQWEEARRLFLELWAEGPTYDVAISLVQVEYQLEHRAAAARYLAFALDHAPPTESVANLEGYRQNLAELEEVVGHALIAVTEPEAELYVDGELVGRSPLSEKIYLEVGKHTIEARLGTNTATRVIDVVSGSRHEVRLELRRAPEPTPAAPARPKAPPAPLPDRTGGPRDRSLLPALVGGTIAAAGIGMFVGFRVSASSDDDRIQRLAREHGSSGCSDAATRPATCDDQREALESYDRKRDWSTAGAAVAATAIVGTVGYYLFWQSPAHSREAGHRERPDVRASVSSDEATLWVNGSF
jgi:hypothetical protein